MAKQLMFNEDARGSSWRRRADFTRGEGHLGPKGRNVLLDKKFGAPP
jgi:chaperonin GroEL (HSP60 family)